MEFINEKETRVVPFNLIPRQKSIIDFFIRIKNILIKKSISNTIIDDSNNLMIVRIYIFIPMFKHFSN